MRRSEAIWSHESEVRSGGHAGQSDEGGPQETLRNAGTILSTQYQSATDAEKKLNESLGEQEQTALELNKIAVPYNVLAREVESDRNMYDAVNTRLRQTTVAMGIEKSPVRVVEEPMAAVRAPRGVVKMLGIGLFLGLALGAGAIIGLDMLDSSLRYVDQALFRTSIIQRR